MSDEVLALANRFFHAIEKGDVEAIRAIYAPDARIWHNNDRLEQTVDENLRVLAWVTKNLTNRHYRVQRRVAIPGGFMQQHVLEAETAGGPFSMPACIVCEVRDGRITRLEEYLDSAQANHLRTLTSR
ncbi:MAG: nuclear transport factor 2 family protein [Alphaproteobacteria bacterium]|jgi:ketosteroid isomerase-like protein|nr:nuclear transport factor 2 family protein [Alphaproteobacteria bacterium]